MDNIAQVHSDAIHQLLHIALSGSGTATGFARELLNAFQDGLRGAVESGDVQGQYITPRFWCLGLTVS